MTNHPSTELLALYSSADLPLLDRWRIGRHLSHCELCDRQFAIFKASTLELKRLSSTETLTGFEAIADWSRLEREMEGNIIVGLDASRCIEKNKIPSRLFIKIAAAAAMLVLFCLGWSTHVPLDQTTRIFSAVRNALSGGASHDPDGPVLKSLPDGIVVGSEQSSLTILHPGSAVVSLSGPSSVEARYADEETGQVTITNVYRQ